MNRFMSVTCTLFRVVAFDPSDEHAAAARMINAPRFELDKAWDAVNFALGNPANDSFGATGDDHDLLTFITNGGCKVAGLTDSRYFTPVQVSSIDEAVSKISTPELVVNFERRDAVADPYVLYPKGFWPFDAEQIAELVQQLRRFLEESVVGSHGLIVRVEI